MPRYTVGQLARRHGLSRSTLLYYDRIGILPPSGRSEAGYRSYDEQDAQRLAAICRYRKAGIALTAIQQLLGQQLFGQQPEALATPAASVPPETGLTAAMAARLEAINQELHALRQQQRFILAYLNGGRDLSAMTFLNGRRFIGLFESAGIDQDQRNRWHAAYERADGTEHQAFLEFLCLPEEVITAVRAKAAQDAGDPPTAE